LIDIDGFVKISCVNRSVNIGKRNEGGLAVFCRHFLNDGITVEKELNYGIVLVKLKCDFFYIENDMYICFSYVPSPPSFLLPILTDLLTHEILTKPSISIKLLSFNQVSLKNKMS
jgi:hypothetical protein